MVRTAFLRRGKRGSFALAALVLGAFSVAPLVARAAEAKPLGPSLRAADVLALREPAVAAEVGKERFERFRKLALGENTGVWAEVVAFEDHRLFTIAVIEAPRGGEPAATWVRRVILLKPATLLVEDLVAPTRRPIAWTLASTAAGELLGRRVRIVEPGGVLTADLVLPGVRSDKAKFESAGPAPDRHAVRVRSKPRADAAHFLQVLHLRAKDDDRPLARTDRVEKNGVPQYTAITTDEHVFRLWLPPWNRDPGAISAETPGGQVVLARRPLPAGILPHTAEGIKLLARWDSAYQGDRRPGWDTGRPSTELKKAVEAGTLKPCRAVELGCGTGTNAIYLASRGFDVTAVDLAPTALARAEEKARKAKVRVRWLLADVLHPPKLEPFDLLFDRGCYHGVRAGQAAAYVETLCRLSKPGTCVLIVAGNASEPLPHYGPPRVSEEEIRRDFSPRFAFEWLRETRFDTPNPERPGAPAWSILLKRK